MKINIETLHFKESDKLNTFVQEKVEKLSRFAENIIAADICLKKENAGAIDSYMCEIKLSVPGNDLFVKRSESSYEKAVSTATDAMEQQLKKTQGR